MSMIKDFLDGYFLWRDAMIAAVVTAVLCGWLGLYVVLRRIVFVSAALPQASGLGIAFAFWLGSFYGEHGHEQHFFVDPLFMALMFSCVAAGIFSLNIDHRKLANETMIGLGYILSSALVLQILNSPRIVQEAHEIGDILFGNAVVIDAHSLYALLLVAAIVLLTHVLLFKEFIAITLDPEVTALIGINVRLLNLILYLTIAVSVSVATRAIGALPVFGFVVIPPTAALMLVNSLRQGLILSMAIGTIAAVIGYFVSYVLSLPTGATMVTVSALWLIPGILRMNR